jgi:hypothetical protein
MLSVFAVYAIVGTLTILTRGMEKKTEMTRMMRMKNGTIQMRPWKTTITVMAKIYPTWRKSSQRLASKISGD